MNAIKRITIVYEDGAERVFAYDSQSRGSIDITYHTGVSQPGDPEFDPGYMYEHVKHTGRADVTITGCDVLIIGAEGA